MGCFLPALGVVGGGGGWGGCRAQGRIPHPLPPSSKPLPAGCRGLAACSLCSPAAPPFCHPRLHLCQSPSLHRPAAPPCPGGRPRRLLRLALPVAWQEAGRHACCGASAWPPPRLTQTHFPPCTGRIPRRVEPPRPSGSSRRWVCARGCGGVHTMGVGGAGEHTCECGRDATACLGLPMPARAGNEGLRGGDHGAGTAVGIMGRVVQSPPAGWDPWRVPCTYPRAPSRRGSRVALSCCRCQWGRSLLGPRSESAWRRTRAASPGRASTATCKVGGGPFPSWGACGQVVAAPLALTLAFLSVAAGACPRLTPPPGVAPDMPLGLPPHGLWSRHILQQTLMDEGLRLARLVSHERVGRLSPCLPGKPPGPGEPPQGWKGGSPWAGVQTACLPSPCRSGALTPSTPALPTEFEDGLADRGAPAPPEPPRGTIKVEQETSRQ